MQADYYGRSGLGRIGGSIQTIALPLAIAGPVGVGLVSDALGGFRAAFILVALVSVFAGCGFFFARPPTTAKGKRGNDRGAVPSVSA
jgi:cyanate permease